MPRIVVLAESYLFMINSARDTLVNSRHFSLYSFFSLQASKFVVHKKLWRQLSEKSPLLPIRTTNESILINHPLCMILVVRVQGKVHKNVSVSKGGRIGVSG